MKARLIMLSALLACRVLAQEGAPALVYLARAADDLGASYWVAWGKLAKQPQWSGTGAFPADIKQLVATATDELLRTRDFTNDFDLQNLIISRVQTPQRQAKANGLDPGVLGNQWVIAAEFLVQRGQDFSVSHTKREVILLDGTIAKQLIAPYKEISAASVGKGPLPKATRRDPAYEFGTGNSPPSDTAHNLRVQPGATRPDDHSDAEYAGIRFRPPPVEWPPGSEFPLEIKTSADIALKRLREEMNIETLLILQEVRIRRYQTVGVYRFHDDPKRHWYWRIEFELRPPHRRDGWPYEVVMLLDQSVLLARQVGTTVER